MKKNLACLALSLVLACAGLLSACADENPYGDPDANREIPENSLALTIEKDPSGHELIAFSAELDPHFLHYNVGKSGEKNGERWQCRAEDWNAIVVPRVKAMNLKRIRVMFLPSWIAEHESDFTNKTYTYDSKGMQSLYEVLDLAKECAIDVNITYWGVDTPCDWLVNKGISGWCMDPEIGMEAQFCELFADCVKYLIEEKGYGCIREITVFNEPTGIFNSYGSLQGNKMYCDICRLMHEAFVKAGIRDRVKFCLSDDTSDPVWLAKTCATIGDIMDIASSHSYYWGDEYSNKQMLENGPYAFRNFRTVMDEYPDIPHFFGEVGLNTGLDTHTVTDADSPTRGLTIPRVMLNMINSGSSGASYWVLFNQYYNATDSRIMNMGLWAFADEGYVCRPTYYSFSLLTRFGQNNSEIFRIQTGHPDLTALALRSPAGKWSYFVVNSGKTDQKISFLNNARFPVELDKYVYDESAVPTDNQVIAASSKMTADGRVLTDVVGGRTFAVYAE